MRKVLLWGDEGSGKSTLAALLARYAVAGGWSVLLVDAGGEAAMHRLLGLPRPKMTLVEDMGGAEYIRRIYPCEQGGKLVSDLPVDSLPSSCMTRRDNLALLSLGVESLEQVGPRSLGLLFREFLGRLDDTGWWVLIDGGPWLEEAGDPPLEVIDGVLEVVTSNPREGTMNCTDARELFTRHGLPLFSVVNRVSSHEILERTDEGLDPHVCFPDEGPVLPIPAEGRGMPFPPGFLVPLKRLWETMMSNFGSPRT